MERKFRRGPTPLPPTFINIMVKCKYCGKEFNSNVGLGIHKKSCDGWIKELNLQIENEYICECGAKFNKRQSLISHGRFCNKYKSLRIKPIVSERKISKNEWQCECGKIFNNYQSLNAHMSHCDYHHECLGTQKKLRPSELNHSMNWENKTSEEIQQIHNKSGKTLSNKIKSGEVIPSFLGKHHSEESKQKHRIAALKYIEKTIGPIKVRYSFNGCKYINKLNEEKHRNLQHAENGGEICIDGYWLDGYDKELNIAFEYDESFHYKDVKNNILNDRDIKRQNYIIKKLHCEFWRYNEKMDLLYKVNQNN